MFYIRPANDRDDREEKVDKVSPTFFEKKKKKNYYSTKLLHKPLIQKNLGFLEEEKKSFHQK